MNCIKKIYEVSFHKLLIEALLIFLLLINASGVLAQTAKAENILVAYKNSKLDAVKLKLLLQLDSIYLYQMPDMPKILDSALLLAQQARQMSVLLHFQADYDDATFLVANAYAEKKQMHSALAIANQTSGVLKVHILIMLGERYLFRPGELKQNSDSAYSFIIQAEKLSDSLQNQDCLYKSLCLKGKYYFITGKIAEGRKCFLQIIEGYQKSGNKLKEADWWAELGRYMPHTESSYNEVISHFKNALFIYKALGKQKQVADALENLSYLHKLHPENLILAETELQEAITIKQSLGLEMYKVYSELAAINILKGNNNVSLFYALAAVKNMDSLHEEEYSGGIVYSQLGMSYKAVGDVDNSLFYFQKALKCLVDYRTEYLFPICGEITQALLKKNKPKEALDFLQTFVRENPPPRYIDKEIVESSLGDCYFALEKLKAAETSYKQMIVLDSLAQLQMKQQVVGERSNTITGSEAYYSMGRFYVNIKQYALAKSYLLKALSFKRLAASPVRQMDIHQLLFKMDSAQNNYVSAIQHLQTQQRLRDSLFTDRKSKQIAELQIQYEMQKKEKILQLAHSQEQVKDKELQRTVQARNFTYIIVAVLLVLMIVGYSRYVLKQKNNHQLMAQQEIINRKNTELQNLLSDKDKLISEKDTLLEEKGWLLKEVHHRVKNNLQIMTSLLNTQAKYLNNEDAIKAIEESRHRMHAMSLIHQKLYQPENTTSVNIQTYITELSDYLKTSFNAGKEINFLINVDEILLDISQAIPIGLILNEVITNAIKYAFKGREAGGVYINMHNIQDNKILLGIKDNGIGLPGNFDLKDSTSMGMRLIYGLAKQINGKLNFENKDGVCVQVEFINDTKLTSIGIE